MSSFTLENERWQALIERDGQADGKFVYAVVTTGIYCRPTCASKLPKHENVVFYDTNEQAESTGFRPCKRCQPHIKNGQQYNQKIIVDACQRIAESVVPPTLAELAADAGYSASYFHRLFKKITGVTPKQYSAEVRAKRVRNNLQSRANVTEAIYESGYNSSSRFYDMATDTLGMKPTSYRKGGAGTKIQFTVTSCYLGWVLIAATETGLCALEFSDDAKELEENLQNKFSKALFVNADEQFKTWVSQVLSYLDSPHDRLDLPLDIRGTVFQQRVWHALRQIPPGTTLSYSQVAQRINQPTAARAVARACASNQIAVAIPCHRVVRQDGEMGGYRWGIDRKRQLLLKEAQVKTEHD